MNTTTREPPELVAREVHPRAIRWMHWINVPLLAVMTWSGLRIYWADDVYAAGIGTWQFFAFFPTWVYERLDIPFALARGMAFHFNFGWLFAVNGLAYVAYLALSGQWRHVVPDRRDLADSVKVVAHDLHLRSEAPPAGRYNAAQKVTYSLVVAMGVLVVASGVAILKPSQATWLTQLLGGYEFARLLHFTMAMGFVAFFVVHVLQVARAGLATFLGMVTGYVIEDRRRDLAGWRADGARSGRTLDRAAHVRQSRRSLLTGAAGVATAALGWRWIQTQPTDGGIPAVLRRGHELNHQLWSRLPATPVSAKQFPRSAVTGDLQLNGSRGLESPIDLDTWRLTIEDPRGEVLDELDLDGVVAMGDPVDMTTLHKCIEGWSQVANWTGIRFSDLAARYADRVGTAGFVYMETPDAEYYVGLERASMLHPQTLLAYELNGQPLTLEHGAPLRLYTPNHYGIKSLKRIGRLCFTNEKPPDFWAERSYDWYSQL